MGGTVRAICWLPRLDDRGPAPASRTGAGAGTGIVTAELVRALPAAHITATDLNPAMVSWAADRVVGPTWLQADAQQLDFPAGSFDVVVAQFGVMFFPDKPGHSPR